ncbi:DUF1446 domain-containing protein [Metarhizium acridum CQMa 102]|uniref:DUF1446 domain-containing protein n=1 Tax=Metarhizium acridum (strain CQMa 102) TaxID=655827 RepID=E9DUE0_METAQ|nr:DUF1446 domain-containing protein [Metarhizium acridum CQMa 102]EFY92602.1 DUF1446 domain-containing protein [Metarhizium acridum CQMa 102]
MIALSISSLINHIRQGDPAIEIYKQATLGDVDFITGDYLAEVNIAQNAEAFALGSHPGFETSELKGLEKTLDAINDKRIKVAINGGALNPKGLAEKVALGDFSGFTEPQYGGLDRFVDPGLPIAEVHDKGSCVITRHPRTRGVVNEDTIKCQLLYELQAQGKDTKGVLEVANIFKDISLKHFSGFHCALNISTAILRPYIAYYPALCQQAHLKEMAHLMEINEFGQAILTSSYPAGGAPAFSGQASTPRNSYNTSNPVAYTGSHRSIRLGDIALERSVDGGPNLNVCVFVRTEKQWEWLRSWLSYVSLYSSL